MGKPCKDTNVSSVKSWEILFIMVIAFIIPAVFLTFALARTDFLLEDVRVIMITNAALINVLLILLGVDILFRREYLPLFFGCHQNPCRSFHLFNKPLPICARCTGIALGIVLALLLTMQAIAWWWFLVMTLPLIIDGTVQRMTDYQSNNAKRFISGLLFAPGLITVYAGFHYILISVALWVLRLA